MEAGAARYSPRPRVAHKLDPYKGIIDERLSAYPKLSAQRLFEEVRAAGYAGGYSRVRDYVREARPRAPEEPLVRFETPAGWQGQVDFGEFRLPWGRRQAFLVVDEIGYLPVSRDGAVLFFQLVNARHEQASTVLTSNKGFEEWGAVLGDEVMAAALIDRLLTRRSVIPT